MRRPGRLLLSTCAAASLGLAAGALVLTGLARAGDSDHERARAAFEAGEIVPFQTILDQLARDFAGFSLLGVELDGDEGRWLYDIELLGPDGAVTEVEYDARDGRFLGVEEDDESWFDWGDD